MIKFESKRKLALICNNFYDEHPKNFCICCMDMGSPTSEWHDKPALLEFVQYKWINVEAFMLPRFRHRIEF